MRGFGLKLETPSPLEAVEAVHTQKVIVNCRKLELRRREAIGHAHDAEEPGA